MKKHQVALQGLRDVLKIKKRVARTREPIDRIELKAEIQNLKESIRVLREDAGKK